MLDHGALAFPLFNRQVALPKRITGQQHQAHKAQVGVARVDGCRLQVLKIGKQLLVALDALPLALAVGRGQVGVKDALQAARAAQLHQLGLAIHRVHHLLATPPATRLQPGRELLAEFLKGRAIGQGLVRFLADVLQQVQLHDLGHGERCLVLLLPDVLVVEPDPVAFLPKIGDGLLRIDRLQDRFQVELFGHLVVFSVNPGLIPPRYIETGALKRP